MCWLVFQRIIYNGIKFSLWIAYLHVMIALMIFKAQGASNIACRKTREISIVFFWTDKYVVSLIRKKKGKNTKKLIDCERKNRRNGKRWSCDFFFNMSLLTERTVFTLGVCTYRTGISDIPFLHCSVWWDILSHYCAEGSSNFLT